MIVLEVMDQYLGWGIAATTLLLSIVGYLVDKTYTLGKIKNSIDQAILKAEQKTELVKQDLQNHKESYKEAHKALVEQVQDHEQQIDNHIQQMNAKIDNNHKIVTDSLTDIKVALGKLTK